MKGFLKEHPIAAILIADSVCCTVKYIIHEIRLIFSKDDGGYKYHTSCATFSDRLGRHNQSIVNRAASSVCHFSDVSYDILADKMHKDKKENEE